MTTAACPRCNHAHLLIVLPWKAPALVQLIGKPGGSGKQAERHEFDRPASAHLLVVAQHVSVLLRGRAQMRKVWLRIG